MTCCGAERTTPFCPQCGRQLKNNLLWDLLALCRKNEKAHRTRSATKQRKYQHDPEKGKRDLMESEDNTRFAEKWKAWGDALAALLESAESNPPA